MAEQKSGIGSPVVISAVLALIGVLIREAPEIVDAIRALISGTDPQPARPVRDLVEEATAAEAIELEKPLAGSGQ